jgi:hypothetical protein
LFIFGVQFGMRLGIHLDWHEKPWDHVLCVTALQTSSRGLRWGGLWAAEDEEKAKWGTMLQDEEGQLLALVTTSASQSSLASVTCLLMISLPDTLMNIWILLTSVSARESPLIKTLVSFFLAFLPSSSLILSHTLLHSILTMQRQVPFCLLPATPLLASSLLPTRATQWSCS